MFERTNSNIPFNVFRFGFRTGEQNGGSVTPPTWPPRKSVQTLNFAKKLLMTSTYNRKVLWRHNQSNLSRPIRYKKRGFLTRLGRLRKIRIRKRVTLPPTTPVKLSMTITTEDFPWQPTSKFLQSDEKLVLGWF